MHAERCSDTFYLYQKIAAGAIWILHLAILQSRYYSDHFFSSTLMHSNNAGGQKRLNDKFVASDGRTSVIQLLLHAHAVQLFECLCRKFEVNIFSLFSISSN